MPQTPIDLTTQRRHFLKWMSATPLLAAPGMRALAAPQCIASPQAAGSVFDFEPVCRANVSPVHFEHMASGIDDKITLRANREALLTCEVQPTQWSGALNSGALNPNMRVELFGTTYDSPIGIAPTGGNTAYHPDGELAVARAARAGNHLTILAVGATASIEEVTVARGGPVWYQLYAASSPAVTRALAAQAQAAGAQALVMTLNGFNDVSPSTQWDSIKRLRDTTTMRLVLKGILNAEDATHALALGANGIIVSNHGVRGGYGTHAAIDALPEVIAAVNGRVPVLIDGGFRRGEDVAKALVLGAHAVCIGRPILWGLGAFGEAGVARVLELLRIETRAALQPCGVPALATAALNVNADFGRRVQA